MPISNPTAGRTNPSGDIEAIAATISERYHPKTIILFGSRARGNPRADSDVDMLVVMESTLAPLSRSAEINATCRPRGVALDLLVKTPAKIADRVRISDPFIARILREGRVLYEQ